MNDTKKAEAALAGIGEDKGKGGETQTGENAELEKLRHTADVWAGRAKQYQEEKKKLEEKIAQLEAGHSVEDAMKLLSAEERGETPDEYLGASARMTAKLVGDAQAKQDEKIAELKREIAERDERTFLANISQRHGDFFESVAPGGDKSEYWERFKKNNKETFSAVMATHDEARFANLVNSFYRELGIPVPGAGATASPTPSTTGGPSPAGNPSDTRTMTTDEYLKELEKAEEMRRAGNMKGWREINDRLKAALNEGRVK